jgi:hypothetical protein
MFSNILKGFEFDAKLAKRYYQKTDKRKKAKIEKEWYEVYYPKSHTTIDAIIYKTWDANAWDDCASIEKWQAICFIRKKNSKKLEKLYQGPLYDFAIEGENINKRGINHVCFLLETAATRKRIEKSAKISFLKKEKKKIEKELRELGV